ncbi:MAG: amino acid ABC transporter substrate-binding protein [Burkholderiales bacterium]|nr:amino acid ABC transporter substrate-binding protein [Burkholderiales bacterium]
MRRALTLFGIMALGALAAQPSLAQGVIKIGAPLALSGALADEGKKQAGAYELWLERVNAAGGISVGGRKMKVELVTYDYQTDEKRAQQIAERLINIDKVDVMTAPFGSGHTKVVAGVAERYGIPIVAVASAEPVHNQGFKYLFGTLSPSMGLIDSMLTYFKEKAPNTKRVAILSRDDVFPKAMATALIGRAKDAGLDVVYQAYYPVGTLDHSAAVTAIRASRPDWIYVTGYMKDLILVRKQMSDLNATAPIVTMITGPAYREFVDGLQPLAENVTSATWWIGSVPYKADDVFGTPQAFTDAIRKKMNQDPDYVHASSAAALIAIQRAIEKAGTLDKAKVRDALAALDIQTFFGPIKFRDDGMNSPRFLPLLQIQDGKPVVLFPADVRQADLRFVK